MPSSVAAMARPSSTRPTSSASKPRQPPSRYPSPATAPKPAKNAVNSARRRSPLSDLNSGDAASSTARPGCFRFLLSSAASGTKSRSASTPRTPARPDPKKRERRVPDQESRTRTERCAAGKEQRKKGMDPNPISAQIRRPVPATKNQWPATAAARQPQFEALTPEKKADSSRPAQASSGATPPVHASISPEVAACGFATPACFAAGHHVVPGVGDRRKCRPRGILAIAGDGITSEDLDASPSRASIHWLSSPLSSGREAGTCSTKCDNEDEASVNWLMSPRKRNADSGVDLLEDEIFVPRCSLEDAFWHFPPDCTGLLGSPLLGGLLDFGTPASEFSGTTQSSGGFLPVEKTPSSGDSISPFSLIIKRASASSRVSSLCAQQGLGSSYRHGSAPDLITVSGESWRESVSSGIRTGLTRTCNRPMKVMDPVVECLEMMSLSPRPGDADYDGKISFQFAGCPIPLESVDLTTFKRSPRDIELKGREASFQKPAMAETRISWREGLVSRMFDMGDLDCCKWLSDDEEAPLLSHNVEALPDIKIQPNSDGPLQKECGDHPLEGGFGSVEFSCIGDELNNDCKASPKPIAVAESMRAEGFELVSSDDSDWTLFYKNYLFEK
ncbi:hypothetical protein QOZ80_9BG0703710 [Eleusine coracana subsp. coracana]|nr:hypothetical protein QOZ80_9BG0703710 [Eleusine coracana subsp. coracana]